MTQTISLETTITSKTTNIDWAINTTLLKSLHVLQSEKYKLNDDTTIQIECTVHNNKLVFSVDIVPGGPYSIYAYLDDKNIGNYVSSVDIYKPTFTGPKIRKLAHSVNLLLKISKLSIVTLKK